MECLQNLRNVNVYTVSYINSFIKNMFQQEPLLNNLTVKGEVSNCKYHTSGHIYFTLKDGSGAISCVMFKSSRLNGLKFQMKEGQSVLVTGSIDTYERDGKYQLYARKIELDGEGALYEKYEKLKKELEERGLFAKEYIFLGLHPLQYSSTTVQRYTTCCSILFNPILNFDAFNMIEMLYIVGNNR